MNHYRNLIIFQGVYLVSAVAALLYQNTGNSIFSFIGFLRLHIVFVILNTPFAIGEIFIMSSLLDLIIALPLSYLGIILLQSRPFGRIKPMAISYICIGIILALLFPMIMLVTYFHSSYTTQDQFINSIYLVLLATILSSMITPVLLQIQSQYRKYKWMFIIFSPLLLVMIAATYLIAPDEPVATYLDISICSTGLLFFYLVQTMEKLQYVNATTDLSYPPIQVS